MAHDKQLAFENFERYSYARDNGHLAYLQKAKKCREYWMGNQWDETVRKKLERQGKPVLTINQIHATMKTIEGEYLQNKAEVSFRPANNGTTETSDALAKTFIQIANNNRLNWVEKEVFLHGMLTSRGYFDCRMDFDDHMRGEVRIKAQNPNNVIIDPDAEEYDPDSWKEIFVSKWLSNEQIKMTFGESAAKELMERPVSTLPMGYDSIETDGMRFGDMNDFASRDLTEEDKRMRRRHRIIERQYMQVRMVPHFVDVQTGDMRPIPENWDNARISTVLNAVEGLNVIERKAEQVKWLTTSDTLVLHNEWSPYKHFTIIPFFPSFDRGHTSGIVEHLLSVQDQLNKVSSQELHIVNSTANSGWKLKRGSLQNMDAEDLAERGAETGVVLELEDPKDAEKIQPNQIPTGLDRIGFKANNFIKEISGVSDSLRGFDREDVAAKAIEAKQVRGSTNLAGYQDNLTRTRHMLAERTLDLVQVFYHEERIIQITGEDLKAEPETIAVNQVTEDGSILNDLTIGEYDVVISTVPPRDTFQQQQFSEMIAMRELNIPVPDDILLEASSISRKAEIVRRMTGEDAVAQQRRESDLASQAQEAEIRDKMAGAEEKASTAQLNLARAQATANGETDNDPDMIRHREQLAQKKELELARLAQEDRHFERKLRADLAKADAEISVKQQAESNKAEAKSATNLGG